MKHSSRALALACSVAVLACASRAGASARIVNGLTTQGYPTTGALLHANATINGNNAQLECSGTLVGCRTFLTAAHCVVGDASASHYQVYLQHAGIFSVSSVTYHPSYNPSLSGRDVAIVKLGSQVAGIEPTPINGNHDLQAMGSGLPGTIVGFGRTGNNYQYGIKRYGMISTETCPLSNTGEGDDKLVCWAYDSSVGAPGTDSNTCNGDSGGPLFMDFSGTTQIVGVTSAGVQNDCQPVDHSWDASVYFNAAWIDGQIGADSVATCGSIGAVGDPDVEVFANSGSLDSVNTSDSFEITVPSGATELRVTLNGLDDGQFGVDVYVKQGSGAGIAAYDCKADGTSVYGSCVFPSPAAGTWSVFVRRTSASGEYQVTSTVFGGTPPVCGNDVAESGEDCDGSDLGSCPIGPCNACSCPAPVCGNDVVEEGETCDGSSDDACPGLCNAGCGCDAPVCGNGILEGSEQCDGAADAACPGSCDGSCHCPASCSTGDLYSLQIVSDTSRFSYKARLFDPVGSYASLDPRGDALALSVSDGSAAVDVSIPAADAGWIKADVPHRKFGWKGDGSVDGLRRVKLQYKDVYPEPYWQLLLKGKYVPGAGSIDVLSTLDLQLGFDGTCNLETW